MRANVSNVIPGFESLTKQQLFDISSAHILKTRTRCVTPRGGCTYQGVGCAAAPFLTKKACETLAGSWLTMSSSKGMVPTHESELICELQRAHDGSNPDRFMREWKMTMRGIANRYNLSTHLIDADKEEDHAS